MSLVHPTSRPTDHLHLHPSVDYLHMPCCLPVTTCTQRTADAPSCARQISSIPPIVSTCTPTLYPSDHLHHPPPYFPLRIPTTILQWVPNDHPVSNIHHLCPVHILVQQPSMPAPHTLYRQLSAPSSIPDCVSVTFCCS